VKALFVGFLVPVTRVQCPGVLMGMIMRSSWREILFSPLKYLFGWGVVVFVLMLVRNRECSHPRVW